MREKRKTRTDSTVAISDEKQKTKMMPCPTLQDVSWKSCSFLSYAVGVQTRIHTGKWGHRLHAEQQGLSWPQCLNQALGHQRETMEPLTSLPLLPQISIRFSWPCNSTGLIIALTRDNTAKLQLLNRINRISVKKEINRSLLSFSNFLDA